MDTKGELVKTSAFHVWDKRLLLEEIGLLSKILVIFDKRRFSIRELSSFCKEDYKAVRRITLNLIEKGYIIRRQARGTSRVYGAWTYVAFEIPPFCRRSKVQWRRSRKMAPLRGKELITAKRIAAPNEDERDGDSGWELTHGENAHIVRIHRQERKGKFAQE